jgi:hypothetical protein
VKGYKEEDMVKTKGRSERQKIDIVDIVNLRLQKGLSYREIEKLTGIDHSTIHAKYREVIAMFDKDKVEQYEQNKPQILSGVERVLVQDMLEPDKREAASLNNVAYAFNTIFQANRLEQGKTNAITEIRELTMQISGSMSDLAKLKEILSK